MADASALAVHGEADTVPCEEPTEVEARRYHATLDASEAVLTAGGGTRSTSFADLALLPARRRPAGNGFDQMMRATSAHGFDVPRLAKPGHGHDTCRTGR